MKNEYIWPFVLPGVILAAYSFGKYEALLNTFGWAVYGAYGALGLVCLSFPILALAKRARRGRMKQGA